MDPTVTMETSWSWSTLTSAEASPSAHECADAVASHLRHHAAKLQKVAQPTDSSVCILPGRYQVVSRKYWRQIAGTILATSIAQQLQHRHQLDSLKDASAQRVARLRQRIEPMKSSHHAALADCKAQAARQLCDSHMRHDKSRSALKSQHAAEVQKGADAAAQHSVWMDRVQDLYLAEIAGIKNNHQMQLQQLADEAKQFQSEQHTILQRHEAGFWTLTRQLQEQSSKQVADLMDSHQATLCEAQEEARRSQVCHTADLHELLERCKKMERERDALQTTMQTLPQAQHDKVKTFWRMNGRRAASTSP